MNMIIISANSIDEAFFIHKSFRYIFKNSFSVGFAQCVFPISSLKYDLIDNACVSFHFRPSFFDPYGVGVLVVSVSIFFFDSLGSRMNMVTLIYSTTNRRAVQPYWFIDAKEKSNHSVVLPLLCLSLPIFHVQFKQVIEFRIQVIKKPAVLCPF